VLTNPDVGLETFETVLTSLFFIKKHKRLTQAAGNKGSKYHKSEHVGLCGDDDHL
jgi:hypothetical protein